MLLIVLDSLVCLSFHVKCRKLENVKMTADIQHKNDDYY